MSLYYLKKEPKLKNDNCGVIILLHGYGSNEEDLFSFANELPQEKYIISARAPYTLQGYGYAWYAINFDADENKFSDNEQAIQSVHTIANFIDEIVLKYSINPLDVTLIGFSQGAILSYAVALWYPEKIKKVAALSGYVNEAILPKNLPIKLNTTFYVSHGSSDQVIPVQWARKSEQYLKENNILYIYYEYPIGHGVSPKNFYDLLQWLNQ